MTPGSRDAHGAGPDPVEVLPRGVSLEGVLRFTDVAADALERAREEVDALNVYPVPDGDTGTNMYLTLAAARDAVQRAVADAGGIEQCGLGPGLDALGRGALLGARGNSGVILSEMLRALAKRLGTATTEDRAATVMVEGMRMAADAAYAAVGTPVEGTMLTVARAAAEAAEDRVVDPTARTRDVISAAAEAARDALAATPQQLRTLADAGVVDAGGRGFSVVLDAAETALTGRVPPPVRTRIGTHQIPVPRKVPQADPVADGPVVDGSVADGSGPEAPAPGPVPPAHHDHPPGADLCEDGPAYEVMYLLEARAERVATLRSTLAGLGDSLVVVGDEDLWNVHVHVDDVGAAIEAGIEAGRPYRIRVTHFAEQVAERTVRRDGRAVVVVSAGPGLSGLYEEAGAVVVEGGPGNRPSTGQLLEAITGCGAHEVVVLPNDPDSVRAAQVAASTAEQDHDMRVVVVPTTVQVQGLAALAVHEPGRAFDADVLEMTATARHARHGAVTVAARTAMTMAGPCEPGDVLGVVAGDFAVVGEDLDAVAADVADRLLRGGGELVTVVAGAEDPDGALAARLAAWVEEHHPHVDVVVYDGGQQRYPLLLAVE